MISHKLQIAMLIAVGLYFLVVFQLLKRKTLNLKYTLLWLASGVVMLVLAVFPQILGWFAAFGGHLRSNQRAVCVHVLLCDYSAYVDYGDCVQAQ